MKAFIQKHLVKSFTAVADAAMISQANIEELMNSEVNYIVEDRLGMLPNEIIKRVDGQINRADS